MKHTDFYSKYKELEAQERKELEKAVLAHGGEFRFLTEDGKDIEGVSAPVIMAGDKHWDSNCDCIVSRVAVDYGFPEIYGYDCGYKDEEIYLSNIEFGHLGYIIDAIPETDSVHDVTIPAERAFIPIVTLDRSDIEAAGYRRDVTDGQLEQVANTIGKYLDWQNFNSAFMENVVCACDSVGIPLPDGGESDVEKTT